MLETLAGWLGLKKATMLVPAIIGAGIAALRAGHLPVQTRIATFACGFAASAYLTTPVTEWLGMTSDPQAHGMAFVLGLIGMTLIEAVMSLDYKAMIQRRAG